MFRVFNPSPTSASANRTCGGDAVDDGDAEFVGEIAHQIGIPAQPARWRDAVMVERVAAFAQQQARAHWLPAVQIEHGDSTARTLRQACSMP